MEPRNNLSDRYRDLPDEFWTKTEVLNFTAFAENASSGSISDDSSASKEAISSTSLSWPEDRVFEAERQALERQLARLTLHYHVLSEGYNESILRLRQAEADIQSLMKENLQLQATNMEFAKLAGMAHNGVTCNSNNPVSLDSAVNSVIASPSPSMKLRETSSSFRSHFSASPNNGLSISSRGDTVAGNSYVSITKRNMVPDVTDNSPTSVLSFDHKNANRFVRSISAGNLDTMGPSKPSARNAVLPKSISIRSPGFLTAREVTKKSKPVPSTSPRRPHRLRLAATPPPSLVEDVDAEYDVYNQGMFKTELCNKWQETGACPYADRCQFAHGLEELRPVIRHPRYKTELCRMVATGDKCPYGHRCHFRHTPTEEEKANFK